MGCDEGGGGEGGCREKPHNPENWGCLSLWKTGTAQGPAGDVGLGNRGRRGHSHRVVADEFLPKKVMILKKAAR